jgi:predicted MFS family arabinose efflux permease
LIRVHRGWWVAGVTFLTLISAAAFRSTTSPMLMPLEMQFGWSRSLTSSALSLNLVFYGLTAPFAATLMARFGVRQVVVFALGLVAAGSGLTVWMTQAWQLFLYWGVFVGFGTGCLALVFASMVANRWFHKHRSLVTGIFSAAYATGQLVFLPLITHLTETVGWRSGALVVAGFSVVIAPIFWFIYREHPRDASTFPVGATEHTKDDAKQAVTVRDNLRILSAAAKRMPFWVLAGTFFVCGWTTNGLIGAHFIPAAHDHGMPTTMAAGLLAVVGIFDFIGTIASGWLTDRVNPVILLVIYYGLRGVALFSAPFLLGPNVEPPLLFFIVFYGLDWIATVPPTVELCRRYFGLTNSPIVYGWVFASHMIGAAIAAAFAGVIRDVQGDYFIAWITAAVLCLVASVSVLALKPNPQLAK